MEKAGVVSWIPWLHTRERTPGSSTPVKVEVEKVEVESRGRSWNRKRDFL